MSSMSLADVVMILLFIHARLLIAEDSDSVQLLILRSCHVARNALGYTENQQYVTGDGKCVEKQRPVYCNLWSKCGKVR